MFVLLILVAVWLAVNLAGATWRMVDPSFYNTTPRPAVRVFTFLVVVALFFMVVYALKAWV